VVAQLVGRGPVDLRRERADVVVELGGLTFIDSAGVRALVRAHEQATRARTRLRFEPGGPAVMRTLELTGVAETLGLDAPTRSEV
jgi:anti-sigma B factor antagonist